MTTLDDDLKKYANETFTKGDIRSGLKLIGEISGIVTLGGLAFTAATVWLPGLNIIVPTGALMVCLRNVSQKYANMTAEERKKVRAVASLVKGGVHKIGDIL